MSLLGDKTGCPYWRTGMLSLFGDKQIALGGTNRLPLLGTNRMSLLGDIQDVLIEGQTGCPYLGGQTAWPYGGQVHRTLPLYVGGQQKPCSGPQFLYILICYPKIFEQVKACKFVSEQWLAFSNPALVKREKWSLDYISTNRSTYYISLQKYNFQICGQWKSYTSNI